MMVQASEIRAGLEVVGDDGVHVGTVDRMDGPDQIRLVRPGAGPDGAGGEHRFLPLSMVARVDDRVRLAVAGGAALAIAEGTLGGELPLAGDPVPPIRNRSVEGAPGRRNFLLPWIVGIVGLVLLLLALRACVRHHPETAVAPVPISTAAALPVEAVTLPDGSTVSLAPATFTYALQRFLASEEPAPRTFQFDKLNFDTNAATIRPEDAANVDALARILAAYPHAIVTITGYADASGPAPANAALGQERAGAVVAALAAKGIDKGRMTARSGGEANPAASNATPQGRFDNRRSELTVTAK